MQVELLRHRVSEKLEKEEPRPRRHLLLQLPHEQEWVRLEEDTVEDREFVLEARVEVQRTEHLRHLQRLPTPVVYRREERTRVP